MTKVYYCTHDHYDDGIEKLAKITKFYSFSEMEEFLLSPYTDDRDHLVVEPGEWNCDGWIALDCIKENVHVGNSYIYEPFNYRQLDIDRGKGYITPTPMIYVVKWRKFFQV